jgi:uncharacterized protein YbjQ (UPF0145 family)
MNQRPGAKLPGSFLIETFPKGNRICSYTQLFTSRLNFLGRNINMIVTTTSTLQGREVENYLGIVSGEAIMGANVVRDFLASVTDVIGGRSSAYENKLAEGREIAIREMEEKARRLGANAIIGVDLDFETLREGMMMCIATGTAVKIKE